MLTFMRNKVVEVEIREEGLFVVYGFLDDHIYGLEVTLQVDKADMTISRVEGHWKRYTTPDCPRAEEFLGEAEGLCLEAEDFDQQVHKRVGRKACRHFANLILECCDAVKKAARLERGELVEPQDAPRGGEPAAPVARSPEGPASRVKPVNREAAAAAFEKLEPAPDGFFIDLHLHTAPASPCASSSVDDMIDEAKRIGLNGICLTDHNYVWQAEDVQKLGGRHDFLILRGNEITTSQGDVLVFGLEQDIQGIITVEALREAAAPVDAFLIAAHPFRGFLAVSGEGLGLDVKKAARRPMFQYVDALETLNSKVTPNENAFCGRVADALGLPATGGSDAHETGDVGIYATRFSRIIRNEEDLLAALKMGDGVPVAFRTERKVDET